MKDYEVFVRAQFETAYKVSAKTEKSAIRKVQLALNRGDEGEFDRRISDTGRQFLTGEVLQLS